MKIILLLLAAAASAAGNSESDLTYNVPREIQRCTEGALASKYPIETTVNPFYLRGDFDGDGKLDYVVRVVSTENKKHGLIVCWGGTGRHPVIVAAGTRLRRADNSGFDDLPMIGWSVYGKRPIEEGVGEGPPPPLIGEAVYVDASESASGILYWTGKTFRWYQQGD